MKQTEKLIGSTPVSALLPILNHIAAEWDLKLSRESHFRIAMRILRNSAKNN